MSPKDFKFFLIKNNWDVERKIEWLNNNKLSLIETNLKQNLQLKIKYNQQRLDRLKSKLKSLEEIKNTGNVRLCFGTNKLFRQQFLINSDNN